jgi:hypothetical protein
VVGIGEVLGIFLMKLGCEVFVGVDLEREGFLDGEDLKIWSLA